MKRAFSIIMSLFVLLACCSCNDVYDETVISDTSLYDTIWNLPERRVAETSALFPSSIEEQAVKSFKCKHVTYQVLGTGWQVELVIEYKDDQFYAETERLYELCENSVVCGQSEYFENSVYATVWNWNACFEYAVLNEKDKTIGYVYLQLINQKDLEINPALIPKRYEMQMEKSQAYSIYE